MRSELAKPPLEGFDDNPPTIVDLICNRYVNRACFKNSPLPKANRAIVIGAGPSVNDETLYSIEMETFYDAILITHPMAECFRGSIEKFSQTYIVDGEFLETTSHFYGSFKEFVHLICPWEKKLDPEWEFRATTFLMPEGDINWNKKARLSPNYPKSTGAIALQVALEDLGGQTIVDVVGIDCTGNCEMYRKETKKVIDRHFTRVNLINCGIGE